MNTPKIVSPEQWLAARRALLAEEKEFTKTRDRMSARRCAMPWVKVEKSYAFESLHGVVALNDLFDGCSQLVVYHFMFGPGWEEGCKSCSYVSDHLAPTVVHLRARDVAFAAVSHAPLAEFSPFKIRMGWSFNWVSAHGSDFNRDYHVSFTKEELARGKVEYNYTRMDFPLEEAPGLSVFAKAADGTVYHTYSTYSRGLDPLLGTYTLLDLVPKGRNEGPESTMSWVRYHDSYEQSAVAARVDPRISRGLWWIGAATLLTVIPKCAVCFLVYAGIAAGLGIRMGGRGLCGTSPDFNITVALATSGAFFAVGLGRLFIYFSGGRARIEGEV